MSKAKEHPWNRVHCLATSWPVAIPLMALIVASLACGPVTPPPSTPLPPPTSTPLPPTNTPAPSPTAPPAPAGGQSGGFRGGGQAEPAAEGVLTPENVAGITELLSGVADETAVLAAAFSPISHDAATFGVDTIVRIWDLDTGNLRYEMPGHTAPGFALSYSPDGLMLASGADDYRVRIWNALTGDLIHTVLVNAQVFRVIWSHDSSVFGVVGSGSSRIELFDSASGEKIIDLQPSDRVLWSAAFAPDSSLIGTADNQGTVSVYAVDTLELIMQDSTTASGAGWDLEFSPDGSLLASCHDGGGVYVWETVNMTPVLGGVVYPGDCVDGVFSSDGRLYFSAGDDGWVYAWDTFSGDELAEINLGARIWTLSMSGDGMYIAAAMDDGTLRVLGLP